MKPQHRGWPPHQVDLGSINWGCCIRGREGTACPQGLGKAFSEPRFPCAYSDFRRVLFRSGAMIRRGYMDK